MKLGLYYFHELDWRHPHGGGYRAKVLNFGTTPWTNEWGFNNNWKNVQMVQKLKNHLNERGTIICLMLVRRSRKEHVIQC